MVKKTKSNKQTLPFASFEWGIAFRYLRSKKKEGFISIISLFSLVGIMLGVATLIIVLAVMNGFRSELLDKILGINGHITIQSYSSDIAFYDLIPVSYTHLTLPTIYSV